MGCQLFGDKGSSLNSLSEIKGGYSFGFCAGYCKADFVFTENLQALELKTHGRESDPPDLFFEKDLDLSNWDRMIRSVNLDSFCSMDDVYGCPDCADGGMEYVTLECEGRDKTVRFEYGEVLPEIRDLLLEVRPLRDSLVAEINRR